LALSLTEVRNNENIMSGFRELFSILFAFIIAIIRNIGCWFVGNLTKHYPLNALKPWSITSLVRCTRKLQRIMKEKKE